MLIQAFLLILTIFLLKNVLRRRKNYPNGPWRLPIIGNLHQLGFYPHEVFIELGKKYGPIFSAKLGSLEVIVLNDYKTIKEALSHPAIQGRYAIKHFLIRNEGIRRGIVITEGSVHSDHKRFVMKQLRDLGFAKEKLENLTLAEVEEFMKTIESENGKPVNLEYYFTRAAVNTLLILLLGQRIDQKDPEYLELIKHVVKLVPKVNSIEGASLAFPWLISISKEYSGCNKTMKGFKIVEKFIRNHMKEHEKTRVEGQPRDLIDAYLEQVQSETDKNSTFYKTEGEENSVFSIFDMLAGGIETSSSSLQFTCAALVTYPEVQEKLRNEIKYVSGYRVPTKADRDNMPYTEAFISEIIRYNSTVPKGVPRRVTEDIEFHGFKFPKGTFILPNMYAAHHDASAWGDPENFRPERFITENGKVKKHEAYVQFGYGSRRCPGEAFSRDTMFYFTTQLVQNFKLLPDPTNPEKPHLKYGNTTFTTYPTYTSVCFVKINDSEI